MSKLDDVKYDIERCICHVPDACRDCSHNSERVDFPACMENLLREAYHELINKYKQKTIVRRWHKNPLGDYTRLHCPWCERELYETATLRDYKVCPFCANPIRYTNNSMLVQQEDCEVV